MFVAHRIPSTTAWWWLVVAAVATPAALPRAAEVGTRMDCKVSLETAVATLEDIQAPHQPAEVQLLPDVRHLTMARSARVARPAAVMVPAVVGAGTAVEAPLVLAVVVAPRTQLYHPPAGKTLSMEGTVLRPSRTT
jgi:hypothetical protein